MLESAGIIPPAEGARRTASVVGAQIDVASWSEAIARVLAMAGGRMSAYVCACNVHVVITAARDAALREALARADLALPDGAPIAWALRRMGHAGQARIDGPGLTWRVCAEAERRGIAVFFYGATESTLARLRDRLGIAFPGLKVAGMCSPPFRPLTADEDEAAVRQLNDSGAGIVFVGLGCPKQEIWMAAHRGRVRAVMLGVGAAFDFHAGTVARAPVWMQRSGLEWLHRFASEPRRLFKRYLVTNTLFVVGIAGQLTGGWLARRRTGLDRSAVNAGENRRETK